jgi:hypothetical protein
MNKTKASAALIIAVALVGGFTIAGVAQASDGGPLILGQPNEATQGTTLSVAGNNGLTITTTQGDGQALTVSQDGDGQAIHAQIGPGANGCAICAFAPQGGSALLVQGKSEFGGPIFSGMSGVTTVPAGDRSVTVGVRRLRGQDRVLATLQGSTGSISVASVVNRPTQGVITIFLTASAPRDMKVAWFIFAVNT